MGRHLGALLLTDPLSPLGAEITGETGDPRPESHQDPEPGQRYGEDHRPDPGDRTDARREHGKPPDQERHPEQHAETSGSIDARVHQGGEGTRHVPIGQGGRAEGESTHGEDQGVRRPPSQRSEEEHDAAKGQAQTHRLVRRHRFGVGVLDPV